jgi:hypothetical protein
LFATEGGVVTTEEAQIQSSHIAQGVLVAYQKKKRCVRVVNNVENQAIGKVVSG